MATLPVSSLVVSLQSKKARGNTILYHPQAWGRPWSEQGHQPLSETCSHQRYQHGVQVGTEMTTLTSPEPKGWISYSLSLPESFSCLTVTRSAERKPSTHDNWLGVKEGTGQVQGNQEAWRQPPTLTSPAGEHRAVAPS